MSAEIGIGWYAYVYIPIIAIWKRHCINWAFPTGHATTLRNLAIAIVCRHLIRAPYAF